MKRKVSILLIVGFFLMVSLLGCDSTTITTEPSPTITDIYARPNQLNRDEEFKVIFTVNNPTAKPFTPYVALDYDIGIEPKEFNIRQKKGEKIELTSISKTSKKGYSFDFRVEGNAKIGQHSIDLGLYDKDDSLAPLENVKIANVEVIEIIKSSNR